MHPLFSPIFTRSAMLSSPSTWNASVIQKLKGRLCSILEDVLAYTTSQSYGKLELIKVFFLILLHSPSIELIPVFALAAALLSLVYVDYWPMKHFISIHAHFFWTNDTSWHLGSRSPWSTGGFRYHPSPINRYDMLGFHEEIEHSITFVLRSSWN